MSLYNRLKQLKDILNRLPIETEILSEIEKEDKNEDKKICYICEEKAKSRGLCSKHLSFALRHNINISNKLEVKKRIVILHKDFDFLRKNTCLVCEEPVKVKGLCNKHYSYILNHRLEVDVNNTIDLKEFIIKNHVDFKRLRGCYICGKPTLAHNLCRNHLSYANNHDLDLKNEDTVKKYIFNNHPFYKSKPTIVKKRKHIQVELKINNKKYEIDSRDIDELIKKYEIGSNHKLTTEEIEIFLYAYYIGKLGSLINSSDE